MLHCGPGLAGPMQFWQVPRGLTKPRGPSDANTALGARFGIFGLEWPRLQIRPPLGKNGDFPENEGGNGALRPRPGSSNAVLEDPTGLN